MSDRRRVNGPAGTTSPPVFVTSSQIVEAEKKRLRGHNELRKICTFLARATKREENKNTDLRMLYSLADWSRPLGQRVGIPRTRRPARAADARVLVFYDQTILLGPRAQTPTEDRILFTQPTIERVGQVCAVRDPQQTGIHS